ncbi:hypothetical protein DM02DRAFT_505225, partial [Periconia macrospinosa]
WGPYKSEANKAVDLRCNSDGLSGHFEQGQTKYFCRAHGSLEHDPHSKPQKSEFWVQWKGKGSATLSDGECKKRLKNEINGCECGGESKIGKWYFR